MWITFKKYMMKNLLFIVLAFASTIAFGQTFVSTTPENKNVILEEYTGIYCVWCPAGHVIGANMHAANPNDVFLINIHTGGFANPSSGSDPNFQTTFGSQLANAAGVSGYPTGTINRRVFPAGAPSMAMSRSAWNASSQTVLAETSPVNLGAQASIDMATGILTVNTETFYTSSVSNTNYLHVAVLQNNMPGPQTGAAQNGAPSSIIPGPWTPTYNHQHVLRHFITGANGTQIFPTSAGAFVPETFTWNVPTQIVTGSNGGFNPDIDPTNLSIVAFIDEGGTNILTGTETPVNCLFSNAFDANVVSSQTDDVMCASETDISVSFRNYGNQPLTSLDFTYDINGGTPGNYNWTGNLAPGAQTTLTVPNVPFTPQPDMFSNPGNEVTWVASNPNGQIDQNNSNNTVSNKFSHKEISGDVQQGITAGNVSIDLTTDQYGSETTWEIVAEDGTIIGSGGPYAGNTTIPTISVNVPGNSCFEFILYDSFGDGITTPPGACLVQDVNGVVIFQGNQSNLSSFSEIRNPFSTGAATGPAWECSPFGCVEGQPGAGVYMSESICESDPTTGCYVGPAWICHPTEGCIDVGTAGLGTYNTEQECINDATTAPCNGTVSINENIADKFNLFPNPAEDILNIEGNFKGIEIYDIFGKLVLSSKNKSEINISGLANGSYYVNILTNNSVINKKVTIAR